MGQNLPHAPTIPMPPRSYIVLNLPDADFILSEKLLLSIYEERGADGVLKAMRLPPPDFGGSDKPKRPRVW
jgi:hypothetical protein